MSAVDTLVCAESGAATRSVAAKTVQIAVRMGPEAEMVRSAIIGTSPLPRVRAPATSDVAAAGPVGLTARVMPSRLSVQNERRTCDVKKPGQRPQTQGNCYHQEVIDMTVVKLHRTVGVRVGPV